MAEPSGLRSEIGSDRGDEGTGFVNDDSDAQQDPSQTEPSPAVYEIGPQEAELEPSPADPYAPGSVTMDDSATDDDGVFYPAREAARQLEPHVARGGPEQPADSVVDEYTEEYSEEYTDPATPDESLDEADPTLVESAQPGDEPERSFDDPAESLHEPTESLDEPTEALDAVAEPADPRASSEDDDSPDVLFTSQSPVLSVKASGPRKVLIGNEAEFVVKVRNDGSAANNVVLSISIPGDADVAGAQSTAGSARAAAGEQQNDALEWTIDRLEADSSETLTLKLVPRSSSPLDLAVNWTFTPETSQTMVEVQEPKLAMSLSGPTEVLYGQTKIYKLTVSNPGNGDTHNVSLGLVPLGRSSAEAAANHALGTLQAGESKTIDVELTARQAGAVTIKAHAFADGGLRAEAAEQVLVRRASLQVEVEAPRVKYAGTSGTFHVKVENTGDATAEDVQLSAVLPPESKFIAASGGGRHEPQRAAVNWTIGSLQPGGRRVFELRCALAAPGENRMQFTAAANRDVSAAATTNTRVEAIADLKLEVRDPQGPISVGDEAVYEIRIRNRGTKAAQGVDLAVFFSEGLEAAAADGGPHEVGVGQVIFRPIDELAAGDSAVFQVRARADAAGNHVFRAEVNCQSLGTKLATEEATHFYGELRTAAKPNDRPHPAAPRREPTLARPPEESPTPARAEFDQVPLDEPLSE